MKQFAGIIVSGLLFLTGLQGMAQHSDYLLKCWSKQAAPLQEKYLNLVYTENRNEFEHSSEPWKQTNYNSSGNAWCNANNFLKSDSLSFKGKKYNSKTQLNDSVFLFLDYGEKDILATTKGMFLDQAFMTARYTPVPLINYFVHNLIIEDLKSDKEFAIYKTTINKTIVSMYISKSDYLLYKLTTFNYDELFGDVLSTYTFSNYSDTNKLYYPKNIQIEKINGKLKDEVKISSAVLLDKINNVLDKPAGFKLKADTVTKPEISVEKYNDNIYFIELKHTDDRVLLVNFSNFILVAEAPLNSGNGELIIREANKIAPGKPVKYFVFGHYHAHYLGGMRAFIHKGAKIICSKMDQEYVTSLAKASHSLNPDSLQLQPKPLLIEEIKDSLTISDGKSEMKIYFIGKMSDHTDDFLVYYFPKEKLLFEDDLVWIAREGEIKKAGGRQAGLYHAIKKFGLNINTIVQSWPVKDYGVKTVIPFEDLEKSMNVK